MGRVLLKVISRDMDKKVTGRNQHRFTKDKCLANLVDLHYEMTGSMTERRCGLLLL